MWTLYKSVHAIAQIIGARPFTFYAAVPPPPRTSEGRHTILSVS